MRRPPAEVGFVARTHGLVGVAAVVALAGLHAATRGLPGVEFGWRTTLLAGGFAAGYLLTAALVWLGVPGFGPLLSRVCSLPYLVRPGFGFRVWDAMGTVEFRTHFRRPRPGGGVAGGGSR